MTWLIIAYICLNKKVKSKTFWTQSIPAISIAGFIFRWSLSCTPRKTETNLVHPAGGENQCISLQNPITCYHFFLQWYECYATVTASKFAKYLSARRRPVDGDISSDVVVDVVRCGRRWCRSPYSTMGNRGHCRWRCSGYHSYCIWFPPHRLPSSSCCNFSWDIVLHWNLSSDDPEEMTLGSYPFLK